MVTQAGVDAATLTGRRTGVGTAVDTATGVGVETVGTSPNADDGMANGKMQIAKCK